MTSSTSNVSSRIRRLLHLPPSATWLAIFLPACTYFLATRLHQAGFWLLSGSAALGEVAGDTISISNAQSCRELATIFYLSGACDHNTNTNTVTSLKHALNTVQETGLLNIVSTVWRHDSELGRGYLLISQAAKNGRIWRWEVGGGPIAIGKTLHLEQSGCRSEHYTPCQTTTSTSDHTDDHDLTTGSGGIAIDFHSHDHFQQGALVVAEWGEGRIVRLEENGARTPVLMQVPNVCLAKASNNNNNKTDDPTIAIDPAASSAGTSISNAASRRLEAPSALLYTPFGDLLVLDHYTECNQAALIQLRHAVHVKALDSLGDSRKAHAWKDPQHDFVPEIVFANVERLGSMALTHTWTSVYVTAKRDGSIVLLQIPLTAEEDDDEEEEDKDTSTFSMEPKLVMNLSQKLASVQEPGKIAVDRKGRVFWAVSKMLLVVDPDKGVILGKLSLPAEPTSVTLGEDGFLYISTSNALLRIRVREGPVKVPTNMVVRAASKSV
jgi:hypothetical protein